MSKFSSKREKTIRLFPHYRDIDIVKSRSFISIKPVNPFDDEQKALFNVIFACDERTGFPVPSPTLVLKDGLSPEVRSFIREKLCVERPVGSSSHDPDVAMEFVRNQGESLLSYSNRLRECVRNSLNLKSKDKSKDE